MSTVSKPPHRQRRTAEAAREHVLEVAERILLERGPAELKLSGLAGAAGVTNGAVLHHFGSIGGVHRALIDRLARRVADRAITMTRAGGALEARVAAGLDEVFRVFADPATARLAAWLALEHDTDRLDEVHAAIRDVRTAIQAMPPDDGGPPPTAEEIDAMVLGGVMMALAAGLFGPALSRGLGAPDGYAAGLAKALLLMAARR